MNYKYRHYRETENILRVNSNIQQNLKYRSITIIMLVGVSNALTVFKFLKYKVRRAM